MLSEDDYLVELGKLGVTRTQFRQHLRDLKVPKICVGRRWFIERFTYLIALRYVMRVGGPDYAFPGSDARRRGEKPASDFVVDPAKVREMMPSIVEELLKAQELSSVRVSRELRSAIESAAQNYSTFLERIEATTA